MTERHAFLSAIRESPDDDTPRLVYADWLEEHGEPERAELVRVQLELSVLETPGSEADPRAYFDFKTGKSETPPKLSRLSDLRRRERKLLDALRFRDAWQEVSFTLTRGILIELANCPWERWREYGDAIWEKERPWRVRLTTEPTPDEMPVFVGYDRKNRLRRNYFAGAVVSIEDQDWYSHSFPEDHRLPMCLARRWPGIDFELPGVTAADVEAVLAERANA